MLHSINFQYSKPWLFFFITFLWSWLFYGSAALTGQPQTSTLVMMLHALGGIGPTLAAIILLYSLADKADRRDFWARCFDLKRIGWRWLLLIFCLAPALTILASSFDKIFGGVGMQLEETAQTALAQPWRFLPLVIFYLLFGPIPEEIGWRGYALDGLQVNHHPIVASLILGGFWATWHLPLFGIVDSYQNNLGIGTAFFWMYLFTIIFQAIIMTWLYNHTHRSTLAAILFHFVVNFTGQFFIIGNRGETILFFLWALSALASAIALQVNRKDSTQRQTHRQDHTILPN
jgi:uncharacterized protein